MLLFNKMENKVAQSGLDALWLKQKIHSDNIANYETPNFKAKTVSFSDVLSTTRGQDGATNHQFEATLGTSNEYTMRTDGNNVNMEKEQLELWKTYSQYNYLSTKISGQFKNMRYVINQLGR